MVRDVMSNGMFDRGYYGDAELRDAGFRAVGKNVRVAKDATIVGLENISIGDNVRIDGGCTITAVGGGWFRVGSHVHIAAGCYLGATSGIDIEDFCGLSHGVKIYSRSDDYSGRFLTNPTVPTEFTGCKSGAVRLGRHVIVGSGTVILPSVVVGEGCAVGALSLVPWSLESWGVYFGCPARRLNDRSRELLGLEAELLRREGTT